MSEQFDYSNHRVYDNKPVSMPIDKVIEMLADRINPEQEKEIRKASSIIILKDSIVLSFDAVIQIINL